MGDHNAIVLRSSTILVWTTITVNFKYLAVASAMFFTAYNIKAGVNIFQNSWIFHPGKVFHFGHFRAEFPNFVIHARQKLSFRAGNLAWLGKPSMEGNLSLSWETFP